MLTVRTGDDGELLEEPYLAHFLTSPAVNARHAERRVGQERVDEAMHERAAKVLSVAARNGHKHLVLGSWGTGVFGNRVEKVAMLFRYTLARACIFVRVVTLIVCV